ncbi:MAG TPA: OmpH family outer membrane protein, partial [Candidatus Cloacimonadota bacterium]|nr:OmpH family outer membrane protein [Candidatus Cloacimonadota bacterium]
MRKISILLIALLAIGMMYAQQTKLGYVNTDRVLLDSNEITEITRLFQLDKQNWTNQIRTLDEEIKRLEREFEIRKLSINEAT